MTKLSILSRQPSGQKAKSMPHDNRGVSERTKRPKEAKEVKTPGNAPGGRKDFPFRHNRQLQPRNREVPQMFSAFGLPKDLTLKSRNVFEIRDLVKYGRIPVFSEHVEDLEILIRILKTIEKHKSIIPFDKNWNPDTPSWKIYDHVLSRIEDILGCLYDGIEYDVQNTEWQISEADNVSYIQFAELTETVDREGYYLFFSFLPKLRRKNKPLFDLLMLLLSGIDKHIFHIFTVDWLEDVIEQEMTYMKESINEVDVEDGESLRTDIERLKTSLKKLSTGIINRYCTSVHFIVYSNQLLKQKINDFRIRKEIERNVLNWCKEGLKLLSAKDCWTDHIYVRKLFRDDQYMDYTDRFAILWSDEDLFWKVYYENRNQFLQECPVEEAYNITGYFPDHVKEPKDKKYMYKFTRFFENGRQIVRDIYKYCDYD